MPSKQLPVIKDGKLVKKKLTGKLVLRGTCPGCGTHLTLSQAEILKAKDVCPDCGAWFVVAPAELKKVQALHDVAVQTKEQEKLDQELLATDIDQVRGRIDVKGQRSVTEKRITQDRINRRVERKRRNADQLDVLQNFIYMVGLFLSVMCPLALGGPHFLLAFGRRNEQNASFFDLLESLNAPADIAWNIASLLLPFLNWLGKFVVMLFVCESFILIPVLGIPWLLKNKFPWLIRPIFLALRGGRGAAVISLGAAAMWGVYLVFTHEDGPIYGVGIIVGVILLMLFGGGGGLKGMYFHIDVDRDGDNDLTVKF
jgi:uncharacterized Zn finger protein (UPF0148 family)